MFEPVFGIPGLVAEVFLVEDSSADRYEGLVKLHERVDDLERAGLKIIQDPREFRFSVDAVLLAAFTTVKLGDVVADLGTGTGVIPLLLSARTRAKRLIGVEIQPKLADMARRSVEMNGLGDRVEIVTGDLKEMPSIFGYEKFDVVVSNPPYMEITGAKVNPRESVAMARHEIACTIEDVVAASSKLLKKGGRMAVVYRPTRLADLIFVMRQYSIEPKRIRFVHSRRESIAMMVLVEGIKAGGKQVTVEPPLVIYGDDGRYTQEMNEIYYGEPGDLGGGKEDEAGQGPEPEPRTQDDEQDNGQDDVSVDRGVPAEERRPEAGVRGTLYVCGTPIGNLRDISERVLDTLRSVCLIAAEDTRVTRKLTTHFGLPGRLVSYHEHNKRAMTPEIIRTLLGGCDVALVSDAGMPGISDPGEELIARAIEAGIKIVPVPGPTALITGLVVSGLPTGRFAFEGFLPRNAGDRRARLAALASEKRTIVLYESPHRIKSTLEDLAEALGPGRRCAVARELTKVHEEVVRGTLGEVAGEFARREPRGEMVIVVEGAWRDAMDTGPMMGADGGHPCEGGSSYEQGSGEREGGTPSVDDVKARLTEAMKGGLDKKAAVRSVARALGLRKQDVYRIAVDMTGEGERPEGEDE